MQRSYPLRWLAFVIALLATQCLDSISDDCTKTLTCGDEQPRLQANCVWRYSNGQEWVGGPKRDAVTGRWHWPDGTETDTQNFDCNVVDAGADAGPTGPDCRKPDVSCDDTFVCDTSTGHCVHCVDSTQCSGNTASGDAGAATVCDTVSHECVECVRSDDCAQNGDRPICKADLTDSSLNRCVQCQEDKQCTGDTPACDEKTNECTSRCKVEGDCKDGKPFCNFDSHLCVECLASGDCKGADSQCKLETNACVECVDDAPCAANGKVCDTTKNQCVQCRDDLQCAGNPAGPYCDTESNLCVQCRTDRECPNDALSRCSLATHVCVGCTDSIQCENGLVCNPTLNGGSCVQCLDDSTCTTAPQDKCETVTGRCVECLRTIECTAPQLARCETDANVEGSPQYACTGCKINGDCSNKGLPGLCRPGDGVCVSCLDDGGCSGNTALSRCGNGGECAVCADNTHCRLFTSPGLGKKACKANVGCVECTAESDCAASPTLKHCKVAESAGAAINTCVECRSNADCTTADKSRCVNNACTDCIADNDCNGADGLGIDSNGTAAGGTRLKVCDAGDCVQCTGPKRAACGTSVCNSVTKACTNFPVGSAVLCGTCVSDAHCASSQRCATQLFGGRSLGPFCFPTSTAGNACNLSPYSGVAPTTTIDGVSANLCLPRRTTCDALGDSVSRTACDDNTDCGVDGLDDGRCSVDVQTCSVPCTTNIDCFDSTTMSCLAGVCQL